MIFTSFKRVTDYTVTMLLCKVTMLSSVYDGVPSVFFAPLKQQVNPHTLQSTCTFYISHIIPLPHAFCRPLYKQGRVYLKG